jgi:IS30 family transposase
LTGLQRQMSGWLRVQFPDDETMRISHETIYRSLFIQARGVLKKELVKHLRSNRMMRRSKKASSEGQPRGQIVDAVSIRERPAEVEDRSIPGHWEGDLISGAKNSHIATLVERTSRFTMLVKIDGKDTTSVVSVDQTGSEPASRTTSIVDLGPRHGDGAAQRIYRCN